MKLYLKLCLLFIVSFAIGTVIAPLFKVETITDQNSINEPASRPMQHHYKDRYGEDITRNI